MESVPKNARTASVESEDGLKSAVVDKERVRGHLDEMVRSTVEQALNQLLDEEADRVPARAGTRDPPSVWMTCSPNSDPALVRVPRAARWPRLSSTLASASRHTPGGERSTTG